ncbi:MAG: FxsA family protein [Pseudolabrys sp.]|nr:FxsA family protein [Pseudolabrys sp.]
MFFAKYVLIAVLALPVAELVVFILVASQIGFGLALLAILAISAAGALVLRFSGGAHIERAKVVLGQQSFSALQADGGGALTLLAGFLLLVPGFITGFIGAVLLIAPLRRLLGSAFQSSATAQRPREPGVVDLEPDDWRHIPQSKIETKARNDTDLPDR